jgi:hypothetical protein
MRFLDISRPDSCRSLLFLSIVTHYAPFSAVSGGGANPESCGGAEWIIGPQC